MVEDIPLDIKVAVMGCVVNGPGEAKEADIGIAGGVGEGLLIKKGEVVRKVPEAATSVRAPGGAVSTGMMRSEGKNGKTFF